MAVEEFNQTYNRIRAENDRELDFKVNKFMVKRGFHWHHVVKSRVELYWEKNGERFDQMQARVIYRSCKRWWE